MGSLSSSYSTWLTLQFLQCTSIMNSLWMLDVLPLLIDLALHGVYKNHEFPLTVTSVTCLCLSLPMLNRLLHVCLSSFFIENVLYMHTSFSFTNGWNGFPMFESHDKDQEYSISDGSQYCKAGKAPTSGFIYLCTCWPRIPGFSLATDRCRSLGIHLLSLR